MASSIRTVLFRTAAGIAAAVGIGLTSGTAQACGQEPYIGEICATAAPYCPKGYLEADGRILAISSQPALASLLIRGNVAIYGGDGVETFAVPDLRGRSPVGAGQGPGLDNVQQGERRGAQWQIIGQANLPPLTGQISGLTATSSLSVGEAATTAAPAFGAAGKPTYMVNATAAAPSSLKGLFTTTAPTGTTATVPVSTTIGGTGTVDFGGSRRPVLTLPPQVGITYCIADSSNIYPPRE